MVPALPYPSTPTRGSWWQDLSSSPSLQTTGLQQCPVLITHNHPQLCTSRASGLTKRGVADMLLGVRGGAAARLDQPWRPQQRQQPQQQRPARHGLEAPRHDTAEPQLSLWPLSDQTDSPGALSERLEPLAPRPRLYEVDLGPIPPCGLRPPLAVSHPRLQDPRPS